MVFVGAVSTFIFVVIPLLLELWAIHLSRRSRGFARWLKHILPGLLLISVLIGVGSGAVAAGVSGGTFQAIARPRRTVRHLRTARALDVTHMASRRTSFGDGPGHQGFPALASADGPGPMPIS